MDKALAYIQTHKCAILKASQKFDIPYATLYNRFHGISIERNSHRPPLLSVQLEKKLIEVACKLAENGNGWTKSKFLQVASLLVGKPEKGLSDKWWKDLKLRHPDVRAIENKRKDTHKKIDEVEEGN
ncbi:helix-turn-helix domain-containing protein [Pedobacter sp.]|uniref:helix-turn-helix domain-containing protein n=1 Tax=Pedobacter sp. TaxID=1411316 RepID=UPI003D7F2EDE